MAEADLIGDLSCGKSAARMRPYDVDLHYLSCMISFGHCNSVAIGVSAVSLNHRIG